MANNEIQPQKVRPLAARLIFAALKVLKENGGKMRGKQVMTVMIYRTPTEPYESYTVVYWFGGKRCRRVFSDFSKTPTVSAG
jgi:hypothetical protein